MRFVGVVDAAVGAEDEGFVVEGGVEVEGWGLGVGEAVDVGEDHGEEVDAADVCDALEEVG